MASRWKLSKWLSKANSVESPFPKNFPDLLWTPSYFFKEYFLKDTDPDRLDATFSYWDDGPVYRVSSLIYSDTYFDRSHGGIYYITLYFRGPKYSWDKEYFCVLSHETYQKEDEIMSGNMLQCMISAQSHAWKNYER